MAEHFENLRLSGHWQSMDNTMREGVKAMWRAHHALDTEEIMDDRVRQVVFVIQDEQGNIGGVSTARPIQAKFLNDNFFFEFRCFIAPAFRRPGLDTLLVNTTREFLEGLPESRSKFKGMLMIIENDDLKKRTRAIWPGSGMVFAGYTSQGHHVRVRYFKGARI